MHRPRSQRLGLFLATVLAVPAAHASPQAVEARGAVPVPVSTSPAAAHGTSSELVLRRLQERSPDAHVLWRAGQAGPSLVTGLREPTQGASPVARARDFLLRHPELTGVPERDLFHEQTRTFTGRSVVTFQQHHDGLEVWGRRVAVTLDEGGAVLTLSNDAQVILTWEKGTNSVDAARAIAAQAVSADGASDGKRVLVAEPAGAFEAAVFYAAPRGTLEAREILVNLVDGSVTSIRSALRH